MGTLAGHLVGRTGGPEGAQSAGSEKFLIQSERALVIASSYLMERNVADAVKTAIRFLLRWVIQDSKDGVVRLSPEIVGLMCLVPCGLVSTGDPDFAFALGTEMMSAVGPETHNNAPGGLVSALVSRIVAGQGLREAVAMEAGTRQAGLGEPMACQLRSLLDWSSVKRLPSAAALGFGSSEYDDGVMKGVASALIHPTSFRKGIIAAANHHGAVLAATLAGALLGASMGEGGIPQEWLSAIPDRSEAQHVTESLYKTFRLAR